MLTSFKGKRESQNEIVFPQAVLYAKGTGPEGEQPAGAADGGSSSSSGLSGGAIAGIAVGAAAGAAAIACFGWLLLRKRRQQQPQGKGGVEPGLGGSELVTDGSWGDAGAMRSPFDVHRYSPGKAASSIGSDSRRLGTSRAMSGEAIPELVAHVAAHEASLLTQRTASTQLSGQSVWDDAMLLPPHLRAWVVDACQVTYLRRADGKLWEIGSGASSKVYRVEYRGEVRPAPLRCAPLGAGTLARLLSLRGVREQACACCAGMRVCMCWQVHLTARVHVLCLPWRAGAGCQGGGAWGEPVAAGNVCDRGTDAPSGEAGRRAGCVQAAGPVCLPHQAASHTVWRRLSQLLGGGGGGPPWLPRLSHAYQQPPC